MPAASRVVRRWLQLLGALSIYGFAGALQVQSGLGLDPWDVLHDGLARRAGVQIGTMVVLLGVLVLVLWWPLRQRPGWGTVVTACTTGFILNGSLIVIPRPDTLTSQLLLLTGGVVLSAAGAGFSIGAGLGPGPRDGLTTGISERLGVSIRLARTSVEATVLVLGYALGGTVGLGTALYAVAIGPLTQFFLGLSDLRPHSSEPTRPTVKRDRTRPT